MNDSSFGRTISFIYFYSVNVKENWAPTAEKSSQPVAKITTIFKQLWKYLNWLYYQKNILKTSALLWAVNRVMLFKVSF